MKNRGRLYVFEGPDGVGKSEISRRFVAALNERGTRAELFPFPGSQPGTIGKLVYDLHHEPRTLNVQTVSASALQALHIAAHLDAIERTIVPRLRDGVSVVLDRFWWSTKVYGIVAGVDRKLLDALINIELQAWGSIAPEHVFLLERDSPLRDEPRERWDLLKEIYETHAASQRQRVTVSTINNDGLIEESLTLIADAILQASNQEDRAGQLALELGSDDIKEQRAPYAFSALSPAKPSIVYDTYWKFADERQRIFFKRAAGTPPPWTLDPILSEFKFTNAYRASDRVSQYLIRQVIYSGDQSEEELYFRIILFKLFNKIETWELLTAHLGPLTYKDYSFKAYDRVLMNAISRNETIYSAAYIMPSGSKALGSTKKHRSHLKLLEQMMSDEVPLRIADTKSMQDAFVLLRSYPMIGDFLAYQYVTDLNYSALTQFSEMEFVVPGPGARGGISKCFASLGGLNEADIIKIVAERQSEEFRRLSLDFPSLWGRQLQLIDCQNLFCEVDKYSRVYHPDIVGTSLRTRIKQKFRPDLEPIYYWYPPKWGLNERIGRERNGGIDEDPRLSAQGSSY